MKNFLNVCFLFLTVFTMDLKAADFISILSDADIVQDDWNFGGEVRISSVTGNVDISIFLDGSSTAIATINQGVAVTDWSLAASMVSASYPNGQHSVVVKVLSGSTLLASAQQTFIIDRTKPKIYTNYFYKQSFGGSFVTTRFLNGTTNNLFVPGFTPDEVKILAPLASQDFAPIGRIQPESGSGKSLSLKLTGILDSTNESLAFANGYTLPSGFASSAYNATTGILSITASPAKSNSEFLGVLTNIVYRNSTTTASLSEGQRSISAIYVDASDKISSLSTITMDVSRGVPRVSITGSYVNPNRVVSLTQAEISAGYPVSPTGILEAQTPFYPFNPISTPFTPPLIYSAIANGALSPYSGQIIDEIEVTLLCQGGGILLLNEGISLDSLPEYTYFGNDIGMQLMWDGVSSSGSDYPMYSPTITSVTDSGSSRIYRIRLGQRLPQQTIPCSTSPLVMMEANALVALRSLRYTNTSTNPTGPGSQRRISIRVLSGSTMPGAPSNNFSNVASRMDMTIIPANASPTCVAPGAALSVDQNSTGVPTSVVVSGFTITDPDGNNFGATGSPVNNPETLTLTAGKGTLTYSGSLADVTVFSGNGTNTLVLRGPVNGDSGTLTQVFNGNRLTYSPNIGFSGNDTITVTLNDNGNSSTNQSLGSTLAKSASDTVSVTVTKVNQPPAISAPSARQTTSGLNHVITSITATDPDVPVAGGATLQMSAVANNGLLSLYTTSGLSFSFSDSEGSSSGTGIANASMLYRGNTADILNSLSELTYRSNTNWYGIDTITLQMNDLGSSGVRRAGYINPPTISAGVGTAALVTRSTTLINVIFANVPPIVTTNMTKTVPIGATLTLAGGTYVPATGFYPPASARLANSYNSPVPGNAGTTATGNSNLVAQDVETKQASGLTYTINLPVTQGALRLSRPSLAVVDLVAGSTFTQDDLNNGYVSYSHNGSLSGDDGFVFTVTDDNATTCPANAPSGQVNGATSQQIFNLTIDRTQPIAIFNGSAVATFTEPVAPAPAVPVLIDNDPLTRVVNATDPTTFVTVGSTGRLTATVTIPTQAGVNPGTVSSDPLDTLTIRDQPPIGFTGSQLFYNGSPIGSFAGGQGTPLVVTLSSALPISVSAVSEVLRHIEYSNPGANPSASQRIVTVTVLNGAGQSSLVASKTVNVVPFNNAPVITPPARPLVLVPGLTLGATVQASDPDGLLSYALSGSPPTRGLVTVDAVTGAYTYTPAPNSFGLGGALTDQFEITVTDPGILTDPVSKTATQLYQVRITDLGAAAPVFTSNPPLETALGRVLTYAPQVRAGGAPGGGNLVFSLVDAPAINPGLGFDPATGTITWPANWTTTPAPTADSYQQFGLLVVDQTTDVAAYQPILLKVLLTPQGSN